MTQLVCATSFETGTPGQPIAETQWNVVLGPSEAGPVYDDVYTHSGVRSALGKPLDHSTNYYGVYLPVIPGGENPANYNLASQSRIPERAEFWALLGTDLTGFPVRQSSYLSMLVGLGDNSVSAPRCTLFATLSNGVPNIAVIVQREDGTVDYTTDGGSVPLSEGVWHRFRFVIAGGRIYAQIINGYPTTLGTKAIYQASADWPYDGIAKPELPGGINIYQSGQDTWSWIDDLLYIDHARTVSPPATRRAATRVYPRDDGAGPAPSSRVFPGPKQANRAVGGYL